MYLLYNIFMKRELLPEKQAIKLRSFSKAMIILGAVVLVSGIFALIGIANQHNDIGSALGAALLWLAAIFGAIVFFPAAIVSLLAIWHLNTGKFAALTAARIACVLAVVAHIGLLFLSIYAGDMLLPIAVIIGFILDFILYLLLKSSQEKATA